MLYVMLQTWYPTAASTENQFLLYASGSAAKGRGEDMIISINYMELWIHTYIRMPWRGREVSYPSP